jgi:hypothetical protein
MYNDAILFALCFIFLVQLWKAYTSQKFITVVVTSDVSRESMIKTAKAELQGMHLSNENSESLVDVQALYNLTESLVGLAQVIQTMMKHSVTHHGKTTVGIVSMVLLLTWYLPMGFILFFVFRWFMMVYGTYRYCYHFNEKKATYLVIVKGLYRRYPRFKEQYDLPLIYNKIASLVNKKVPKTQIPLVLTFWFPFLTFS